MRVQNLACQQFAVPWEEHGGYPLRYMSSKIYDRAAASGPNQASRRAQIARLTIAPVFIVVGIVHLARPDPFLPYMPAVVPRAVMVIMLTGVAEIAGAIGLFASRTRSLAGVMLALYAVCVYPVNISHAVHDLSTGTG